MAGPAMAAGAIFSVIGGMNAKSDAKAAAKREEEMAMEQARNTEIQTREEARRATKAEDKVAAQRRARAAASGTKAGGSQQTFMDSETEEFNKQIEWLKSAGASTADYQRLAGINRGKTLESQGDAAMWGGIASGVSQAGSAYSNW